jgi:hypothetical protein
VNNTCFLYKICYNIKKTQNCKTLKNYTLSALQQLRKIVFFGETILHGTKAYFDEIRPSMTDGEVAVCATVIPEIALYSALIARTPGKKLGGGAWNFTRKDGKLTLAFRITQTRLDFLLSDPVLQGYVYPIDTYDFEKRNSCECRLYKPRALRKRILVTDDDLPFQPLPGKLEYKIDLPYKMKHHFVIQPIS